MRIRRFGGLAVVALWQLAPVTVEQDTAGNVQVAVGFGAGREEQVITNCEGQVTDRQRQAYESAGGSVDVWVDPYRVSAFGRRILAEEVNKPGPAPADTLADRLWVGLLGVREWEQLGLGIGPVVDVKSGNVRPAAHLRVGPADKGHTLVELGPPDPPFGGGSVVRLGAAYSSPRFTSPRGAVGLASCLLDCFEQPEDSFFFVDLGMPVSRWFAAELQGAMSLSGDWGISGGGRVSLGMPWLRTRTTPAEPPGLD